MTFVFVATHNPDRHGPRIAVILPLVELGNALIPDQVRRDFDSK